MKTTREMFGERVAELRKQDELTQAELATELTARLGKDVAPLTVTRIEAGSRPTSIDELIALGEVFKVLPEVLLPSRPLAASFKMCTEQLKLQYREIQGLEHQLASTMDDIKFIKGATDNVHVLRTYQTDGRTEGVRKALVDLVNGASHPQHPDLPVGQILNELIEELPPELKELVSDQDPELEGHHSIHILADSLGRVIEGIDGPEA